MTVLQQSSGKEKSRMVSLDKGNKPSFGIRIVRGEVKDSPNSKLSGIFIKDIVEQTPAHLCGQLKIGDRILTINDRDVRSATEEEVVMVIKQAGKVIDLEIQTFEVKSNKSQKNDSSKTNENGYILNGESNNSKDTKQESSAISSGYEEASAADETDSDDEDTRDMTGRIYTAGGYEIDRASAGNVKVKGANVDKETEDIFGYTSYKIKKRYRQMGPIHKIELVRPVNTDMGVALAGHKDRRKMACIVAGINPNGIAAKTDLKPGDEILEINGQVLYERCHLNAGAVFRNLTIENVVFIVLRHPSNKPVLAVPPVKHFPTSIDETEYLFSTYKNVRKLQIQKAGTSLGIMIIEGKHAELGNGIFVSDIQAESNAEQAGLRIGEMILAINKDVILDTDYDTAAGILKRAGGIVTLIVANAKTDEEIAAEKKKEEEKKAEEERKKKERELERQKELEKPQDPATAEIKPNKKTLIEIKVDKQPLGCMLIGGKDNYVTTGAVITHIQPEGAIAKDNRLQIFDQILDFNGDKVDTKELSTLKVHQLFNLPYAKIKMTVWRNDPLEIETLNVDIMRKPGKDLGLALLGSPKGVLIQDIVSCGCPDVESKLQRGDIISKINGENLDGLSFEECYVQFRLAQGKCTFEITRPKPTTRT